MLVDHVEKDTVPGSDPVSVVQPAPVKEHDRKLPEVQVSEERAKGTGGLR
jgi:hypothetical protein